MPNKSKPASDKSKEAVAKFLCDYFPLIIFIIVYKFSSAPDPLVSATLYLLVSSFVALIIAYILTKKIAKTPLISAIILGIFGGLTLISGDDFFIKIKPTLINSLFAIFLFYGYFTKRPLIKHLFGESLKMQDGAWLTLSLRWALFFIFLAALNEFIWRNFPTDFWVNFKVFGVFPLSMIFTLSQVPFMVKNIRKN
jgi:intracellular septation protein